jgi:hypothetical protein
MTKSEAGLDELSSGEPPAGRRGTGDSPRAGTVPLPELVERFRQFEARVDEAVRLIAQLRKDKQRLEAKLEETTRARAEAVRRVDALIDKIDSLL